MWKRNVPDKWLSTNSYVLPPCLGFDRERKKYLAHCNYFIQTIQSFWPFHPHLSTFKTQGNISNLMSSYINPSPFLRLPTPISFPVQDVLCYKCLIFGHPFIWMSSHNIITFKSQKHFISLSTFSHCSFLSDFCAFNTIHCNTVDGWLPLQVIIVYFPTWTKTTDGHL